MSKITVAALQNQLAVLQKKFDDAEVRIKNEQAQRYVAEKLSKESTAQFDDLKTRLHASEMENQRLRGYVQRVQEDDVVREDMIMVGDPEGERQLVPKRKPTTFGRPQDMTDFSDRIENGYGYSGDRQRKTKHWVTY